MLRYQVIPVTAFEQNCSLIWCDQTGVAAVVDPGGDLERIERAIAEQQVKVEKILLTHAHIDHAGGTAALARQHGLPIIGPHEDDDYWIQGLPMQAQMFGFGAAEIFKPDQWLQHGDTVTLGDLTLQVLHCPGHTPGHVVFFEPEAALAFVGDVLFHGSIGRTDFPGGDHDTLIRSIREKLFPLGGSVRFIPGHGPESTFATEQASNPFVGGRWG